MNTAISYGPSSDKAVQETGRWSYNRLDWLAFSVGAKNTILYDPTVFSRANPVIGLNFTAFAAGRQPGGPWGWLDDLDSYWVWFLVNNHSVQSTWLHASALRASAVEANVRDGDDVIVFCWYGGSSPYPRWISLSYFADLSAVSSPETLSHSVVTEPLAVSVKGDPPGYTPTTPITIDDAAFAAPLALIVALATESDSDAPTPASRPSLHDVAPPQATPYVPVFHAAPCTAPTGPTCPYPDGGEPPTAFSMAMDAFCTAPTGPTYPYPYPDGGEPPTAFSMAMDAFCGSKWW